MYFIMVPVQTAARCCERVASLSQAVDGSDCSCTSRLHHQAVHMFEGEVFLSLFTDTVQTKRNLDFLVESFHSELSLQRLAPRGPTVTHTLGFRGFRLVAVQRVCL